MAKGYFSPVHPWRRSQNQEVSDGTYAATQDLFGDRGVFSPTLKLAYSALALSSEMKPGRVDTRLAGQKPLAHEQDLSFLQRRVRSRQN